MYVGAQYVPQSCPYVGLIVDYICAKFRLIPSSFEARKEPLNLCCRKFQQALITSFSVYECVEYVSKLC